MSYIGDTSPLYAGNETYLAELYARFLNNPASVDPQWSDFFQTLDEQDTQFLDHFRGASWAPKETGVVGRQGDNITDSLLKPVSTLNPYQDIMEHFQAQSGSGVLKKDVRKAALDSIRAIMLIRAYRVRGHKMAHLDPLHMAKRPQHPELSPATYGFTPDDYERPIFINNYLGLETATLSQILEICQKTYCGTIGVEFMHIQNAEKKSWIQEQLEGSLNKRDFTILGKKTILERLTHADGFESLLDKKWRGTKRFGLDGGEATVPMLEQILKRGTQLGVEEAILGMTHRGRLNVLANIINKPYHAIFSEFMGHRSTPQWVKGSGDVKYHLGASFDREFDDKKIHVSLTPNPSHLECVNTVVLGKVRAKQDERKDKKRRSILGILIHGDAAFIGQGVVAETFLLSKLDGYKTGGTIHIVINNQIGFTTVPSQSRSSPYPSDMAKIVDAPVFHVNGDDPEACVHVARLATDYRQKFGEDVVIDMWCYRRHGHNEGDEPVFTQPAMYKAIAKHERTQEIYAKKLVKDGVLSQDEAQKISQDFDAFLNEEFKLAQTYQVNKADWLEGRWSDFHEMSREALLEEKTGVSPDLLKEVGQALVTVPQNFNINSKINRQLKTKMKSLETGKNIDWGTAEALAYGTLLSQSTDIRLSGEDSQRGTFSHRHSVWIDQDNEQTYTPLNNIRKGQAHFEVLDSPLSEFGVLGFEYGYTMADPYSLVIWEAQFGDFANGAQVIIDQYIASAQTKWLRMSGLVMLLPHGMEGQGPEHSSARLERFLQLSAEDNWQVVNITTPANFFHALRRQIHRSDRKPLIQMSPKSLLRHKHCISSLEEFTTGTRFHRILPDAGQGMNEDKDIKRVVLCSGKVYYDLDEARTQQSITNVVIIRLEQLYPFPDDALEKELARYPNANVVWCQEETENSGAWFFVDRRIEAVLTKISHKTKRPRYVGRGPAASPATGYAKKHLEEQTALVAQALTVKT